jgi:hypothetical protein
MNFVLPRAMKNGTSTPHPALNAIELKNWPKTGFGADFSICENEVGMARPHDLWQ